jgi:hypothetical protein
MDKLGLPRRLIATAGAVGGAIAMRSWGPGLPQVLWLPAGLLGLSALLVWSRSVGGQLIARAVWWSNLILGTVIALASNHSERSVAALLVASTGAALLAAGDRALDAPERSGRFVPLAFRGTLMCMLVMAMADAQSLLLFGSLERGACDELGHCHSINPTMLAIAGALLLSVYGLYRLRVWGLGLVLVASAVLAGVSFGGLIELPSVLRAAYGVSGIAQWLVCIPLMLAIARGNAGSDNSTMRSGGAIATRLIVATMMVTSLGCWAFDARLWGWS